MVADAWPLYACTFVDTAPTRPVLAASSHVHNSGLELCLQILPAEAEDISQEAICFWKLSHYPDNCVP